MPKFCTKCGNELLEEAKFCVKCGKRVNAEPTKKKSKNEVLKRLMIGAGAIYLVICFIAIIAAINDTVMSIDERREKEFKDFMSAFVTESWAVEAACKEVKSNVYKMYGIIPNVSGELIYQDRQNYVVTVRYEIPDWQWKSSCACLIYGYGEDNCHLRGMTNELSYDYDYRANLDDLKALWKLD